MNTCDIGPSGVKVWATSPEDAGAPFLRFETDPLIALPIAVQDVRVAPDGLACIFRGQNGTGYDVNRVTRVITPLGPVYSPEAMAYSPGGTPVWVESQTGYRYGGMRIALPAHRLGTSQGILEVNGPDAIVWMDDILGLPAAERTFGGITFVTFRRLGAWVFGNSQVGCAAVNTATGRAYLLPEMNGTSNTLRGALDGSGHLTVMASRPSRLLVEAAFTPYVRSAAYAPVVSIGRPLWMGWFFGTGAEPGNCAFEAWAVQGHREVRGPGWRYVAGDPDGDPAAIATAIAGARAEEKSWPDGLRLDVLAYVPQKAFAALPTSADLQGIECYLWSGEDDATFLRTRAAAIAQGHRVVLIAQCYDNQNPAAPDLRRVPGLISQLARDHANVEGILVFSGSGRATGWQDHPEVHDAWRAVFAGITGTPAVSIPAPVPPPLPTHPPAEHIPGTDTPEVPVVPVTPFALYPGDRLLPGDDRRSGDGRTRFILQLDGNIVLYHDGAPVWAAGTQHLEPAELVMQGDGHLVAYDEDGAAVWGTNTHGHPGAYLLVRSGEAVITADGEVLWRTVVAAEPVGPPPSPVTPPPVKTSPRRPDVPSGRPPNILKAVKDFLRAIGLMKAGPKPQLPTTPTMPPAVEPPPPIIDVPPVVRWPTRDEVLHYRGHLCNLRDASGRVIWTPSLPGASPSVRAEWLKAIADAGGTHVPIGPFEPGYAYDSGDGTRLGWPNPDWTSDPDAIRALCEEILNTPSAHGHGLVPVVFLDGGGDTPRPRIDQTFPMLRDALDGLQDHVLPVLAWEPVVGSWRSSDVSYGLQLWHRLAPAFLLGYHGSPERLVGSSNPLEPDDPWQGGESAFYQTHGGEHIDVALYQTPHGRALYEACSADDDACWLNRWRDYVTRIGGGLHGWRVLRLVLLETVAFEFARGQATSDDARTIASRAKAVADAAGVTCYYGNGLPWEMN